jgi:hypothetical protein
MVNTNSGNVCNLDLTAPTGEWTCIAVRGDESTVTLYEGSPGGSLTQVASESVTDTDLGDFDFAPVFGIDRGTNVGAIAGAPPGEPERWYDGDIDRVRMADSDVGESTLQEWFDATKGDY